jgi:hypothetical protein
MDIFKSTREQVIFAFQLAAHPGEGGTEGGSYVLAALHLAGVPTPAQMTAERLAQLREHAQLVLAIIHTKLLPEKAAALLAKYSKDWPTRRTACDLLRSVFQRKVGDMIDSPGAVEKLVLRHYIQERDRAGDWDVTTIASTYHLNVHTVRQAWSVLVLHAEMWERAAMDAVEINLAQEAAHA